MGWTAEDERRLYALEDRIARASRRRGPRTDPPWEVVQQWRDELAGLRARKAGAEGPPATSPGADD